MWVYVDEGKGVAIVMLDPNAEEWLASIFNPQGLAETCADLGGRFGSVLRGCGEAVGSIRRAAEEVVRRILGRAWKT